MCPVQSVTYLSGRSIPVAWFGELIMSQFSLLDILPSQPPPLRIVDVGAMLGDEERYAALAARGAASVIGFEPIPAEREKLDAERPGNRYLPEVLGDGSERLFNTCRFPGCSSFYQPDPDVIDRFFGISTAETGNFQVIGTQPVHTRRLDDIEEIEGCDYLKLDVQGAELDVLAGAARTLGGALMVQLEVDQVMRSNGFFLHKMIDVAGRAFRPLRVADNPVEPMSQMLWADAVYARAFTDLGSLSTERLLGLALLLHDLYGSIDFCAFVLKLLEEVGGLPLLGRYLKEVGASGPIEASLISIKSSTK